MNEAEIAEIRKITNPYRDKIALLKAENEKLRAMWYTKNVDTGKEWTYLLDHLSLAARLLKENVGELGFGLSLDINRLVAKAREALEKHKEKS